MMREHLTFHDAHGFVVQSGYRISFRLICSCTKVRSKESTHLIVRFSIPALYTNRPLAYFTHFCPQAEAMDSPYARARRNLTLPEVSLTDVLSLIPVPERNLLTLAPSPNLEIHI